MNFTFGIREKTTLLVIILVAAAAYFTPQFIAKHAKHIYEERELVDLSDEASLRTWEILDDIERLEETTAKLANDAGYRNDRFRADVEREMALIEKGEITENEARWRSYLRADVLSTDGPRGPFTTERELLEPRTASTNEESGAWQPLLDHLRKANPGENFLSPIHRVELRTEDGTKWVPIICAGARIRSDADADANGGPEYVLVMFSLERPRSNRHLLLLIDGDRYVHHPGQDSNEDFANKAAFDAVIAERRKLEDEPLRGSLQRMGFIRAEDAPPLRQPYFFRSGTPTITTTDGEPVTSLEKSRDLSDSIAQVMEDVRKEFGDKDCRIGGLGNQVSDIRLLAPTRVLLEELCDAIRDGLMEAAHGGFVFEDLKWHPSVECDEIDTTFVKFEIGAVTETGREERKEYEVLFSGFRDEFALSIEQKLAGLEKRLAGIALGAGIIAFIAALLFVRPLRKITHTAQSVADTSNEALGEKVDAISKSLPVARTDEVGEIARALRRLFSEIQAGTRQLDQRVRERTLELEKANAKLKDVNREKDTFLANVSHELRNPLNVVDGYLQFLEASDLDEEQQSDVRKSRKAAKALLELINDILDYQKITMRGITLEPEEVEVAQFIGDIRDSMEIHAERNKNKLVFDSSGDLGTIVNDNKRLRQVILNLMGNACKFTQKGTVTLDTKRFSDNGSDIVEFRVKDTGRGMTPEEQSKIFTVFYTNKKANESGTGLGLAISRELCRLMGGRISLESSIPGKGSTFLVRVPTDISEEPPLAEQMQAIPEGSQTVLIIDDNDSVREMMRRFLTKQGYEVIEAKNGKEGIELARARSPDAITLDAVMPEIDGWDVLSTLKSDLATASIPVVMVTILNKEAKGFALGADDYIVKPIDWDRFSQVLGNLTDQNSERTILVVDDEEPTRDLFRRALGKEDCRILEAENGEEAIRVLEETQPDIIVLDLMMPVMDGFEFLAEYNRRKEWQAIPVIVVTAKTPTPEEREFLDGTVARVLQKGAGTTEELFATVHRRVDGHTRSKPRTKTPSKST